MKTDEGSIRSCQVWQAARPSCGAVLVADDCGDQQMGYTVGPSVRSVACRASQLAVAYTPGVDCLRVDCFVAQADNSAEVDNSSEDADKLEAVADSFAEADTVVDAHRPVEADGSAVDEPENLTPHMVAPD